MAGLIALTLLAQRRQCEPVVDEVDCVEIQQVHNAEDGRLAMVQFIAYDFDPYEGKYQVVAWRIVKSNSQIPLRDYKRGGYTAVFHDDGLLREVHAKAVRFTADVVDYELEERKLFPMDQRRQLSRKLKPYERAPRVAIQEADGH